jgi:hypothetical protein
MWTFLQAAEITETFTDGAAVDLPLPNSENSVC